MKSFVVRMTREDQDASEFEALIGGLALFLGAEVKVSHALEVRAEHPAIVGLLERLVEDLPQEQGVGLAAAPVEAGWVAEAAVEAAAEVQVAEVQPKIMRSAECRVCGKVMPGRKFGTCQSCQDRAYRLRKKAQETTPKPDITQPVDSLPQLDASGDAPEMPVYALRSASCGRVVASVNPKTGRCASCQMKGVGKVDETEVRIERVVAEARAAGTVNENPFAMPARRLELGGRKVG